MPPKAEVITQNNLALLYVELRREIDLIGKAVTSDEKRQTEFPDPVNLSPIERRVLVKSIFSFLEAIVYGMKMFAVERADMSKLSRGELALAEEEEYQLAENGSVTVRSARLRFLSNLRFAFQLLAKTSSIDFVLDVGGPGWQYLVSSVKVRDRLMHPKRAATLTVTDTEIRECLKAFIWVDTQLLGLLAHMVVSLRERLDLLKSRGKGEAFTG